jgi:hypothetical protein
MSRAPLTQEQKKALAVAMVDALRRGDAESLAGCLRLGGDPAVSVPDADSGSGLSRPVMHWAAIFFRPELAGMVIAAGDVNCRSGNGDTALFAAIAKRDADALRFFTERGADPLAQNFRGEVAIEAITRETGDSALRRKMMQAIVARPVAGGEAAGRTQAFNQAAGEGTRETIKIRKPLTVSHKPDGGTDGDGKEPPPQNGGFKL